MSANNNKCAEMAIEKARLKWKVDEIYEKYSKNVPEIFDKFYPATFSGTAKDGSLLLIHRVGKVDFRGIYSSTSVEEYVRYCTYMCEYGHRKCEIQSKKLGKIVKLIVLFDANHLSYHQLLWRPGIQGLLKAAHMYEECYHGMLHKKCFIVNAPRAWMLFWALVKQVFSENTLGRMRNYGTDTLEWIPELLSEVDADVLPRIYGGKREDTDLPPMCKSIINMDTEIPRKYYSSARRESVQSKSQMQKMVINSGEKKELDFDVKENNTIIKWEFVTEGGDIGFGISFQSAEGPDVLIDVQRTRSDVDVEDGEINCEEIGKYTLIFDNTFSLLRSKVLSYNVAVIAPVQCQNGSATGNTKKKYSSAAHYISD